MKKLFIGSYFLGLALYTLFTAILTYILWNAAWYGSSKIVQTTDGFEMATDLSWKFLFLLLPLSMIVLIVFMATSFKKRILSKYQLISLIWIVSNLVAYRLIPPQIYLVPIYTFYRFHWSFPPSISIDIILVASVVFMLLALGYNFYKYIKSEHFGGM